MIKKVENNSRPENMMNNTEREKKWKKHSSLEEPKLRCKLM